MLSELALFVNIASVTYLDYTDEKYIIVDGINNSVITYTQTIIARIALHLLYIACFGQFIYCFEYSLSLRLRLLCNELYGSFINFNSVWH